MKNSSSRAQALAAESAWAERLVWATLSDTLAAPMDDASRATAASSAEAAPQCLADSRTNRSLRMTTGESETDEKLG